MPLYMDRHDVPDPAPEEAAQAHLADLAVQEKYGVRYITYWLSNDGVSCLVEAPSIEAAVTVHREAHGLVPGEIVEVTYHSVQNLLGTIREPSPGQVWRASAFRTMLAVRPGDGSDRATFDAVARDAVESRGGVEARRDDADLVGCFSSVAAAMECALAIQRSLDDGRSESLSSVNGIRVGVHAGEPVRRHRTLYGATIDLAVAICSEAHPGTILVSRVVRDLCVEKGFVFAERGRVRLRGIYEPTYLFELQGKDEAYQPRSSQWSADEAELGRLTSRQAEVLSLIARGKTNHEIAEELVLSDRTVQRHVSDIYRKIDARNRAEATAFALSRLTPDAP